MRFIRTLLWLGAAALTAPAQSYSNPVREVEKPGKSAVFGACDLNILAGNSISEIECTLVENEQNIGVAIPAGKVLVIEDISVILVKATADVLNGVRLSAGLYVKALPMQVETNLSPTRQRLICSIPMRTYVRPGFKVYFQTALLTAATADLTGTVKFIGHFESTQ
jgi:hypothetical protein